MLPYLKFNVSMSQLASQYFLHMFYVCVSFYVVQLVRSARALYTEV